MIDVQTPQPHRLKTSPQSANVARRAILLGWVAVVVGLCISPLDVKILFHTKGHLHEIGHVCVFCLTGLLLAWNSSSKSQFWLLWVPAAIGLGALTELIERRMYGAHLEWSDILLDTLGVLLAALISIVWPATEQSAKRQAESPPSTRLG